MRIRTRVLMLALGIGLLFALGPDHTGVLFLQPGNPHYATSLHAWVLHAQAFQARDRRGASTRSPIRPHGPPQPRYRTHRKLHASPTGPHPFPFALIATPFYAHVVADVPAWIPLDAPRLDCHWLALRDDLSPPRAVVM